MRRIEGRSTAAHMAAKRFLRGVNLANSLEAPPGQDWGGHYTSEDLRLIRNEGFDHVRIPVAWHHYTGPGPDFRIKPEIFARVDELVDAGLQRKAGRHHQHSPLRRFHHESDRRKPPEFVAIWTQLAEHYAKSPDGLAFELLNEPKDAATTEVINPIFAKTIAAHSPDVIPTRTIFVGPGRWNSIGELPELAPARR